MCIRDRPQAGQTLQVAGNALFQPGSTLQVGATPQQTGNLNVTGQATLDGGTVQVLASRGRYLPNQSYTILNAAGGVTGQFGDVNSTYAFLTPMLKYNSNQVLLALTPNGTPFASVATTHNRRSVAAALGIVGAGNAAFDAVQTADAPTADRAFAQLSGDLYPSTRTALLEDSSYMRNAVLDRARAGWLPGGALCGCEAPVSADDGAASLGDRLASQAGCTPTASYKPAVWGGVYASTAHFGGDDAASVSRDLYGFVVGTDAQVSSHWRVGIAGGASRSLLSTAQNESEQLNGGTVALYASGQYGAWGLRGGVAQSWYSVDSTRNPSFGGFADHDTASYNANLTQVFGEVGYALAYRNVSLEPFAGLAYVNAHTDSFKENGGAAALQGEGGSTGVGYSTLGLRASTNLAVTPHGNVSVYGSAGWQHAFGTAMPNSTLAFEAGGPTFGVAGVPIARDTAVLGLGIDAQLTKNLTFGLSYRGQLARSVSDDAVYANLLWKF